MTKLLFEHFPSTQFPTGDPAVNRLAQRFGGWLKILDPLEVPTGAFLGELERVGYSRDEFEAMRVLLGASDRQRLIVEAAGLRTRMRQFAKNDFFELAWKRLSPELAIEGITDSEIERAEKAWIPYLLHWQSHRTSNDL